jgi:alkanesulfonate monooxygenase
MSAENGTNKRQKKNKPLLLNFMVLPAPSHLSPANWAHPNDRASEYKSLSYWTDLAKLAEKHKINAIFIADVLGPYDVFNGPHNFDAVAKSGAQFPLVDPSIYISAMASVTESVAFGCTFSTISEAPYHFARRIATLDHATNGRIGWNVVTSYLQSAARNLLDDKQLPPHDKRYDKADEYLEVVYKLLLSSWRDDAVIADAETLTYCDPSRIREINHQGEFFNVPGPHVVEPSKQRFPVVLQAGASERGRHYSAKHAEVVFISGFTPEDLKTTVDTIRKLAKETYNRDPSHLKFISELSIILGDTHEEAEAKFKDYAKYQHFEGKQALIGGWTGLDLSKYSDDEDLDNIESSRSNAMLSAVKMYITTNTTKTKRAIVESVGIGKGRKRLIVGTPNEVADELQRYVDIAGLDGFNFVNVNFPSTFEEIGEKLIPVLRERGLASTDYAVPGGTFRENLYGVKGQTFLPKDHYAHDYRWTEGTREEFKEKLDSNYKTK